MVLPGTEVFHDRWDSPQSRRLGARFVSMEGGRAEFALDLPYGDERDDDPMMLAAGLAYALDTAALAAVVSGVDRSVRLPNGTASLHIDYLEAPGGAVRVQARVVHWSAYDALVEIEATDEAGGEVARGLSVYSMRPMTEGGTVR